MAVQKPGVVGHRTRLVSRSTILKKGLFGLSERYRVNLCRVWGGFYFHQKPTGSFPGFG